MIESKGTEWHKPLGCHFPSAHHSVKSRSAAGSGFLACRDPTHVGQSPSRSLVTLDTQHRKALELGSTQARLKRNQRRIPAIAVPAATITVVVTGVHNNNEQQ